MAVYFNQGKQEFSFAFVRDITDRKLTGKTLVRVNKKLNILN